MSKIEFCSPVNGLTAVKVRFTVKDSQNLKMEVEGIHLLPLLPANAGFTAKTT